MFPLASKPLPSSSLAAFLAVFFIPCELHPVLKGKLLTQRSLGVTCTAYYALKLKRDTLQGHGNGKIMIT